VRPLVLLRWLTETSVMLKPFLWALTVNSVQKLSLIYLQSFATSCATLVCINLNGAVMSWNNGNLKRVVVIHRNTVDMSLLWEASALLILYPLITGYLSFNS